MPISALSIRNAVGRKGAWGNDGNPYLVIQRKPRYHLLLFLIFEVAHITLAIGSVPADPVHVWRKTCDTVLWLERRLNELCGGCVPLFELNFTAQRAPLDETETSLRRTPGR